jgi:hypothetical protein
MARKINLRATRRTGQQEVRVFGERDPRGPDNHVYVWVDEQDRLHIRVLKVSRCYELEQVVETPGYIEVIQK